MARFHLFEGPLLLLKPFELQRRFFNFITEWRLQRIDTTYSREGLKEGIRMGIHRLARDLREENTHELLKYTGVDLQTKLKMRLPEIPREELKQKLNFELENVRRVDIHSMVISLEGKVLDESSRFSAFVTAIGFIDPKGTGPISQFEVGRRINDLLVCNITFSRMISPMGRWRISDVNYFDPAVVSEKAPVLV
ncbi:unnamed protein product [Bursaphelenchus xylophilus]|uniref:(pine wood nematode) hypothetical protein n=1 Tax=Bursaphelenchus xylophilus TaxID=6326 RepID=A0A7I8WST6_BURXY|nr:unnamed protein product [Bursaphelenchus xylophilus]CAG9115421.1 unnamed protein product [Bursaphelenchus xylophilus]